MPIEAIIRRLKRGCQIFALVLLATLVSLTSAALAAEHRNIAAHDPGGIFEILRGKHSLMPGDGSKWSDAIDSWISNVGVDTLEEILSDENGKLRHSLTRSSIWEIWETLRARTRELAIKKFYPFLVSGRFLDGQKWRLHCADAHRLCMDDTNCYWKYANFLSSCSDENVANSNVPGKRDHDSARGKQSFWPSYRWVRKKTHTRRSVKRDLHVVEKQIRKEARLTKRARQRKHRRKSTFWMGQNIQTDSHPHLDDILRYFSMKMKSNRCSSKCVNSLIMLNETVYGILLAHCDCRAKTMPAEYKTMDVMRVDKSKTGENREEYLQNWEETCVLHQRTAQSCRPRIFGGVKGAIGCTATRLKCEKDSVCKKAQDGFLSHCSQVINGLRCTTACRDSVRALRNATSEYDSCVCDGAEGPTCRQIRNHVVQLCDSTSESELIESAERSRENRLGDLKAPEYILNVPEGGRTRGHKSAQNSGTSSAISSRNILLVCLVTFARNIFKSILPFR